MWQDPVPLSDRASRITYAEAGDEMGFVRLDCPFGLIYSMDTRRSQLKIDLFIYEGILEVLGAFFVKDA